MCFLNHGGVSEAKKRLAPKTGSKASKKTGASHDPHAGLDVSMNTTFIWIVNEKGEAVKELEAVSTPESIDSFLSGTGMEIEKIGLESSFLTHYLKKVLKKK